MVLGASGLLGRAVLKELQEAAGALGLERVVGTAHSRVGGGLLPLDVTEQDALMQLLQEQRPAYVLALAR